MADTDSRRPMSAHRLGRVVVAGAALCLAVSGCSAGQITQTATQVAAVNGASANGDTVALRNVYVAVDSGEPRSNRAELAFYAINTGAEPDRLVAIESDAATVTIDAAPEDLVLKPGTAIASTMPVEHVEEPTAPDRPITATVELRDGTVEPGLTMPFTFVFERAGEIPIQIPFDVAAPGEDVPAGRAGIGDPPESVP